MFVFHTLMEKCQENYTIALVEWVYFIHYCKSTLTVT